MRKTPEFGDFLAKKKSFQEVINNKIATIGENISLRRIKSIKGPNIYAYVHNSVSKDCGKIGVLVSLEGA